jgi:hypothetical protein|tara:strand:- start:368 stop:982 length:615 start_codon:yes stop_codon:yes gene_type:complete
MQQLGNIITPKKLTQTDAPTVDVASADTATNVDHNIAKALLEFHKTNPHAFEDKKNPHFKNNYASLESVIKTVRTASQFGLTFTQEMDFEGDITFVRTVMMHSSGATRVSRTKIVSKDPNDPQKMGSAISYAKRYGLQSIFGLPSDDDDGEIANKVSQPSTDPLIEAIKNAQSINELNQIYKSNQPFTETNLKKIKAKRGELEK